MVADRRLARFLWMVGYSLCPAPDRPDASNVDDRGASDQERLALAALLRHRRESLGPRPVQISRLRGKHPRTGHRTRVRQGVADPAVRHQLLHLRADLLS